MDNREQGLDTQWGYPHSEARIDVKGRVDFSARAEMLKSGWLRVSVAVYNTSLEETRLLYRGCPVQIHLYQDEKLEGQPVWDSFQEAEPCAAFLKQRTLEPLGDIRLRVEYNVMQILGETLATGNYYAGAIVRPNGIRILVPAGVLELEDKANTEQGGESDES